MRVFVTGACGFVGRHLVKRLVENGHDVVAAVQNPECVFDSPITSLLLDVLHSDDVAETLRRIQPDVLIHLAAQSMVMKSWEEPLQTMQVNLLGTINILDAIRRYVPTVKLINIGSGDEYGLAGVEGVALSEDMPCRPQNPYAVSKCATGQVIIQLAARYGLQVLHLRPFNHFGPGQHTGYVVSDFISRIVDIENKKMPPVMRVGDLNARRDFMDVRDVIDAYVMLAEKTAPTGVYNVCSGQARSMQEIVSFLLEQSTVSVEVVSDPVLFRPSEVPVFVGCANKLFDATGWVPSRDFFHSLLETLQWYRKA